MPRKVIHALILTPLIVLLIVGGYCYWLHQKRYPSTDDAYIQTDVINVAAQLSGKVAHVFVHNQETVRKAQLLFTIDPTPFKIALQKAEANLQNTKQKIIAEKNAVHAAAAVLLQRKAELTDTQKNYDRIISLVKQGYYAKSGADTVMRELSVAKQAVVAAQANLARAQATAGRSGSDNAQLQAATAAVAAAEINLRYTQVVAPAKGQLAQFTLQPGQTITAYESLFSLVENKNWWAIANMKETNLDRLRVGQCAVITVDMYPSHPFRGIVKSISPGSGSSFALLPAENASGNWVKVTQRFPVRVNILHPDPALPLRIGASCTVTIDTK